MNVKEIKHNSITGSLMVKWGANKCGKQNKTVLYHMRNHNSLTQLARHLYSSHTSMGLLGPKALLDKCWAGWVKLTWFFFWTWTVLSMGVDWAESKALFCTGGFFYICKHHIRYGKWMIFLEPVKEGVFLFLPWKNTPLRSTCPSNPNLESIIKIGDTELAST